MASNTSIAFVRTVQLETGMTMELGYRCIQGEPATGNGFAPVADLERLLAGPSGDAARNVGQGALTAPPPRRTGR